MPKAVVWQRRQSASLCFPSRASDARVAAWGPLAQVVFSDQPVSDYRGTRRGDAAMGRSVMLGLFERGVFLNPMGTKLYLSIAHDEAVCDDFLARFDDTLVGLG